MPRAVTHALRVLLTFYFSGASFLQRCENTKPEPLRLYRFPTLCVTMSRGTGAEGRGDALIGFHQLMVQLRSKAPGAKRSRPRRCFYCLCDVTKCPQVFTFCGQHAEAVKCAVEVKLPLRAHHTRLSCRVPSHEWGGRLKLWWVVLKL